MDTTPSGEPMSGDSMSGGRSRRISWPLLITVLALGAMALVMTALRDGTPRLTREAYESARALWDRRAITDYTIDVLKELDRQAPERLRTVVRSGQPASLTIDDAAVSKSATYTVAGLFEMIERELEMAASKARQPGQPGDVALRAVFDEETGVPLVFKRLAGKGRSVIMTVTSFEVESR